MSVAFGGWLCPDLVVVCSATQGEFVHSQGWKVALADFYEVLVDPPKTDRTTLQWNSKLIGKHLIMYLGAPYNSWSGGSITAYNHEQQKHTISWLTDETCAASVDLLACKYKNCKEWRLLQPNETLISVVDELNCDL